MKRLALCLLAMAVPGVAFAGDGNPTDGDVNLNVSVIPADFSQGACGAYLNEGQDCSSSSHAGVAGQAFIVVVASNVDGWTDPQGIGNGLAALQFGVEHSGLDVLSWFLCTGDLEIPQNDADGVWPESGTGNAVTWPGGCYDPGGENASVGLLLVSDGSAGSIQTTVDPRAGFGIASYTDCDAFNWEIDPMGGLHGANIGDGSSLPVCSPIVPTEEKSWGQIKSLF